MTIASLILAFVLQQPNVVVVIADDLGRDHVASYGLGNPPPTPTLDLIAGYGVRFTNVYSSVYCSASRSTLMTGRHGFRYGIGWFINPGSFLSLPLPEVTMAEVFQAGGYQTACIGKWHMGNDPMLPIQQGFDYFEGTIDGVLPDFFAYTEVTSTSWGTSTQQITNYATTETTDDAIDWIQASAEPFFTWVAYHSPHNPIHVPPAHLFTGPSATNDERFDAMVESLDAELFRLWSALPPNTYLIFLGDNGTPPSYSISGPGNSKTTLKEGGVHVPFLAWGPGIPSGVTDDRLMSFTDWFPTILGIAGLQAPPTPDAVDYFSPPRPYVFAEVFNPFGLNERVMVRDDQGWKLIRNVDLGSDRLYNLSQQPDGFDGNGLNVVGHPVEYNRLLGYLQDVGRPGDI